MNKQCESCAFGKAGGAADEPKNRLTALIAAYSGIPFNCHHGRSGVEFNWQASTPVEFFKQPPEERKVCEGWRRAVAELNRQGHFKVGDTPEDQQVLRTYQRSLGVDALRCLDNWLTETDPKDREDLRRHLFDIVRAIAPEETSRCR